MGLIVTSAPEPRRVITTRTVEIGKTYCQKGDTTKLYMAIRRMDNDPTRGLVTTASAQLVSLDHGNTVLNPNLELVEVKIQAAVTLL